MSGVNQIHEQNEEVIALMSGPRRTKKTTEATLKKGGKIDVAHA